MDDETATRLLAFYLFDVLGKEHPQMTFLERVGVASTGAVKIIERQPSPLPAQFIERLERLAAGVPGPEDPPWALPWDGSAGTPRVDQN